ncbi:CAP domain-containing protein [Haloarcula onubensis]|uniref:CAP domain-containing protein n=1 Tax=Haloarcula onubensis TaxID=2950539 RepID=A0ABU2FM92_9EURY|nr:CAP domain-containing protein [Halomicroarcula sp. S3CR25-11]MDS0281524.1 CAP domain-containing protein [Halomicroarcula sp. S3CR25-11]
MVNKAFLSLAAVVLFAVFGTGVFVGMQVGGAAPGATDAGPQADTPDGTDSSATPTPAAEPAATPTPSEGDDEEPAADRERIPPREFNERNVSAAIVADVNDAREAEGLEPLSTTGTTTENLRAMAAGHSDAMAEAGLVRHTIDGVTSADRYRQYDLYSTCQFQVESYIEDAENDALEAVGRTYAGQEYPDDGTQRFNANDTAVAAALTDDWLSTGLFRERLFYGNADRIGVGVTVTSTGAVYATANVC